MRFARASIDLTQASSRCRELSQLVHAQAFTRTKDPKHWSIPRSKRLFQPSRRRDRLLATA